MRSVEARSGKLTFEDWRWSLKEQWCDFLKNIACLYLNWFHIALWRKPLRKVELRILSKIITFAPIFSSQNYFRWKYLDVISFAVSLSIYIWVWVENRFLQQLNCQRISCVSNRLREKCESNWRDQLTRTLKKWI